MNQTTFRFLMSGMFHRSSGLIPQFADQAICFSSQAVAYGIHFASVEPDNSNNFLIRRVRAPLFLKDIRSIVLERGAVHFGGAILAIRMEEGGWTQHRMYLGCGWRSVLSKGLREAIMKWLRGDRMLVEKSVGYQRGRKSLLVGWKTYGQIGSLFSISLVHDFLQKKYSYTRIRNYCYSALGLQKKES